MSPVKVTLTFPQVEEEPVGKPSYCPRCGSPYLSRHGTHKRSLTDTSLRTVSVQRYRCAHCAFTFRHYPLGVGRSRRSGRMTVLASLLRTIGLSCTKTAWVIKETDSNISQATVWRTALEAGFTTPREKPRLRVRILEEGEEPKEGDDVVVRFMEDPGSDQKVGIEIWDYRAAAEELPQGLYRLAESNGMKLVAATVAA